MAALMFTNDFWDSKVHSKSWSFLNNLVIGLTIDA